MAEKEKRRKVIVYIKKNRKKKKKKEKQKINSFIYMSMCVNSSSISSMRISVTQTCKNLD